MCSSLLYAKRYFFFSNLLYSYHKCASSILQTQGPICVILLLSLIPQKNASNTLIQCDCLVNLFTVESVLLQYGILAALILLQVQPLEMYILQTNFLNVFKLL